MWLVGAPGLIISKIYPSLVIHGSLLLLAVFFFFLLLHEETISVWAEETGKNFQKSLSNSEHMFIDFLSQTDSFMYTFKEYWYQPMWIAPEFPLPHSCAFRGHGMDSEMNDCPALKEPRVWGIF